MRTALPVLGGVVHLDGLDAGVDVFRDPQGVPHVRATTPHDAFFAQGFVHAQDRLWHMCYDRRRAAGRLAEWLGPQRVRMDKFARRMALESTSKTDYEAFDTQTRGVLDAYAAGVNAYIASDAPLPYELRLLGIEEIEPWEPWHSGSAMKVRHVLMGAYDRKLWRAQLMSELGPKATAHIGTGHGREDTLVTPVGARMTWTADTSLLEPTALAFAALPDGSNNWAVHGSRTASGKPLVAGDPHRALEVPNVYYQIHIACPEFDAIGISMPGIPGMFHFGHNERVAWCVTHAMADTQDLYVERFDDDGRYEFQGEWHEPARRTETITVRDAADVEVDITQTRHGPVVFGDRSSGTAIAMRWTGTDGVNTSFRSLLPMLRASTVDELEETMRFWVDPCNNFVMADVDGTIAYLYRGRVPVRPHANGYAPVPGWTGEYEWDGDVPFEELPRVRNPETGYLATANNRVVADDYPYYVGMDYSAPYRVQRVLARLAGLDEATADDMASIHADRVSIPSELFREAVETVCAWDGVMEPGSAGAAIYSVMREQLAAILLEREPLKRVSSIAFTDDPLPTPAQYRVRATLPRLMQSVDTTVIGDATWKQLMDEALARALDALEQTLGPDRSTWSWDRIHFTRLRHPLSRMFPDAAEALDPPSVSTGGDGETVHATGWDTGLGVVHSSVARYVFDLGDWDNSGWVVPLGGSGHPASDHYTDQAEAWARVELFPMTYSWPAIEAGAEAAQTLEPAK